MVRRLVARLIALAFIGLLPSACRHRGPIISLQRCALQCELDVVNSAEGSIDVWTVDTPGGVGQMVGSIGPGAHERLKLDNRQAGLPSAVYSYPAGAKQPVKYCRVTKRAELVLSVIC